MIDEIKEYDIVALLETVSAIHKDTQQPIQLKCGQVGTVVMSFGDRAFLIEQYALAVTPGLNCIHPVLFRAPPRATESESITSVRVSPGSTIMSSRPCSEVQTGYAPPS